MKVTLLWTVGFAVGIVAAILIFITLGSLNGGVFPFLGSLSVLAGIFVGSLAQSILVKRFIYKASKDV